MRNVFFIWTRNLAIIVKNNISEIPNQLAVWSKLRLAKSSWVQVHVGLVNFPPNHLTCLLQSGSSCLTNFTDNSQMKNSCSSDKVYDSIEQHVMILAWICLKVPWIFPGRVGSLPLGHIFEINKIPTLWPHIYFFVIKRWIISIQGSSLRFFAQKLKTAPHFLVEVNFYHSLSSQLKCKRYQESSVVHFIYMQIMWNVAGMTL
jgi:hypothetical protein